MGRLRFVELTKTTRHQAELGNGPWAWRAETDGRVSGLANFGLVMGFSSNLRNIFNSYQTPMALHLLKIIVYSVWFKIKNWRSIFNKSQYFPQPIFPRPRLVNT
jgi:hypothetical protein